VGAGRAIAVRILELQNCQEAEMPTEDKASSDYKRPEQNVADLKEPVTLSKNKARGGIRVRGMVLVLIMGTLGALVALVFVRSFFGWG